MSQAGLAGASGGGAITETLTGNTGGAVPPSDNNINLFGVGGVNVAGNIGTSTLTISISSAGFTWSDKSGDFTAVAQNGYFCNAALTATLPASPTEGDTIIFNTTTGSNVILRANTGQSIILGNTTTTVAGAGTSSEAGTSIIIVYRSGDTSWHGIDSTGTWVFT